MNNLTQTNADAKAALLNQRQERMINLYQSADAAERRAIVKHIDSFFENGTRREKIFWLKFRLKLEAHNEKVCAIVCANKKGNYDSCPKLL